MLVLFLVVEVLVFVEDVLAVRVIEQANEVVEVDVVVLKLGVVVDDLVGGPRPKRGLDGQQWSPWARASHNNRLPLLRMRGIGSTKLPIACAMI